VNFSEGLKAFERYVREPKAEENHVISTVRRPGEQIGLNETHPFAADLGRRDGEHFQGMHPQP
jgi:hypothetical protein